MLPSVSGTRYLQAKCKRVIASARFWRKESDVSISKHQQSNPAPTASALAPHCRLGAPRRGRIGPGQFVVNLQRLSRVVFGFIKPGEPQLGLRDHRRAGKPAQHILIGHQRFVGFVQGIPTGGHAEGMSAADWAD